MRSFGLVCAVAFSWSLTFFQPVSADELQWRHGMSLMGDIKYQPGFAHFDYVNPNAPKGGLVRLATSGTFDNFNIAVAGVKGQLGAGIGLLYDTLLTSSLDEVSTAYGELAESLSFPDDISSVTYRLRANAKWHDGKPITPEDVIFSFDVLKANSPQYAAYYAHVIKAEKTGERDVTFTFDQPGNRELPQIVGQLNLLDILHKAELRQLDQRISIRCELQPLGNVSEVNSYIAHRLAVAAGRRTPVFGRDALALVHRYSEGVPRVINLLCDRALTAAYASARDAVEADLRRLVRRPSQRKGRR